MNPASNNITLRGKRIRVWTGGKGPALLLLHSAWGDAAMSWSPVWSSLGDHFTVIAPDLPGFGSSEPLDQPTLAGNAVVLKDLLEYLKTDRSIVVGNSFGVAVALEFASTFPDRTRRVVLVNGGYLPLVPGFIKKAISLPIFEKRFRALMRKATYSDKAFARAFPNPDTLPLMFFERIRRNEETQSRIVFDTFMRQTKPQVQPQAPVTMIWGTGDRLVTMKQAGMLRTWLGNPDYIPIEGAGHMPQAEQPEAFVEAIKRAGGEAR
jgi:pimeloyl-ACP methyl ester carboxylesterase